MLLESGATLFGNKMIGGTYLTMVGGLGMSSLVGSLPASCASDGGVLKTLKDVTYSNGQGTATSVAIFLASIPAEMDCASISLSGMTSVGGGVTFAIYPESYLLKSSRAS
jgi:hypothetical protein